MIILKSLCLWEASEELSPNTGGSGITWQSQCFFQFWVVQTLILTKLLISVVPRNFLLPKNTCRCFFLEYLSKLAWENTWQFHKAMPLRGCNSHSSLQETSMLLCTPHVSSYIIEFGHFVILSSYFFFYRPGKCQCFI